MDDLGGWGSLIEDAQEATPRGQDEPRPGDWRNIWVLAEVREGHVRPAVLEVLGKARQLADGLGVRVAAVLLGKDVSRFAPVLGWAGADRVYLVDDSYFETTDVDLWRVQLRRLVNDRRPELLLMVQSPFTDALAGLLSSDLATGAVAGCHDIELDTAERLFTFHTRSYTNRVESRTVIPRTKPQIATVVRRSQPLPAPDRTRQAAVSRVIPEVSREDSRVRLEGKVRALPADGGLENARIVVLAGKGVSTKESLGKVRAIASLLGGEVAGTKAACDLGIVERERLVGRTGKRIRPELLIALGAGGTTETLEGIDRKRLRLFLAVDLDPQAPIFSDCDVAVVADLNEWADHFLAEAHLEDEAVSYQIPEA